MTRSFCVVVFDVELHPPQSSEVVIAAQAAHRHLDKTALEAQPVQRLRPLLLSPPPSASVAGQGGTKSGEPAKHTAVRSGLCSLPKSLGNESLLTTTASESRKRKRACDMSCESDSDLSRMSNIESGSCMHANICCDHQAIAKCSPAASYLFTTIQPIKTTGMLGPSFKGLAPWQA